MSSEKGGAFPGGFASAYSFRILTWIRCVLGTPRRTPSVHGIHFAAGPAPIWLAFVSRVAAVPFHMTAVSSLMWPRVRITQHPERPALPREATHLIRSRPWPVPTSVACPDFRGFLNAHLTRYPRRAPKQSSRRAGFLGPPLTPPDMRARIRRFVECLPVA